MEASETFDDIKRKHQKPQFNRQYDKQKKKHKMTNNGPTKE